jgi:tellurite resistance protein TerC
MEHWVKWVALACMVGGCLLVDLGLFHRHERTMKVKKALALSCFWIAISLVFNLWILIDRSPKEALQFFTGYLLEKSLSIDNLFVFSMLFAYFKVPKLAQYRVLYFGIIGAIVMRLCLIWAGVSLVSRFEWLLYILGVFLAYTGLHMMLQKDRQLHPEESLILRMTRKFIPMTHEYEGKRFFTKKNGAWVATPLLIALVAIETTDLIFALDSIPAIFAITLDPFIVFSSNIFAILGLRSLYFVLAHMVDRFIYLKQGIAIILILIGCKMALGIFYEAPTAVLLCLIAFILGGSVWLSLRHKKPHPKNKEE